MHSCLCGILSLPLYSSSLVFSFLSTTCLDFPSFRPHAQAVSTKQAVCRMFSLASYSQCSDPAPRCTSSFAQLAPWRPALLKGSSDSGMGFGLGMWTWERAHSLRMWTWEIGKSVPSKSLGSEDIPLNRFGVHVSLRQLRSIPAASPHGWPCCGQLEAPTCPLPLLTPLIPLSIHGMTAGFLAGPWPCQGKLYARGLC